MQMPLTSVCDVAANTVAIVNGPNNPPPVVSSESIVTNPGSTVQTPTVNTPSLGNALKPPMQCHIALVIPHHQSPSWLHRPVHSHVTTMHAPCLRCPSRVCQPVNDAKETCRVPGGTTGTSDSTLSSLESTPTSGTPQPTGGTPLPVPSGASNPATPTAPAAPATGVTAGMCMLGA